MILLIWIFVVMGFPLINTHLQISNKIVDEDCDKAKRDLGDALASFTDCAILHSYPITLCQDCVNEYINILNVYKNLTASSSKKEPCINQFINLDRLGILNTLYENNYDLWNRAKCYECFNFEDGKLTNKTSNETLNFGKLQANLTNCTSKVPTTNDTSVCWLCMDEYLNMNNYYESITNENERIGVCMDIVDKMNTTRKFWSSKCAKFRYKDEHTFLITVGAVIGITILFYLGTKVFVEKRIPIILRQNRFIGSVSQSQISS